MSLRQSVGHIDHLRFPVGGDHTDYDNPQDHWGRQGSIMGKTFSEGQALGSRHKGLKCTDGTKAGKVLGQPAHAAL